MSLWGPLTGLFVAVAGASGAAVAATRDPKPRSVRATATDGTAAGGVARAAARALGLERTSDILDFRLPNDPDGPIFVPVPSRGRHVLVVTLHATTWGARPLATLQLRRRWLVETHPDARGPVAGMRVEVLEELDTEAKVRASGKTKHRLKGPDRTHPATGEIVLEARDGVGGVELVLADGFLAIYSQAGPSDGPSQCPGENCDHRWPWSIYWDRAVEGQTDGDSGRWEADRPKWRGKLEWQWEAPSDD